LMQWDLCRGERGFNPEARREGVEWDCDEGGRRLWRLVVKVVGPPRRTAV
jgi:hypothetical protein